MALAQAFRAFDEKRQPADGAEESRGVGEAGILAAGRGGQLGGDGAGEGVAPAGGQGLSAEHGGTWSPRVRVRAMSLTRSGSTG